MSRDVATLPEIDWEELASRVLLPRRDPSVLRRVEAFARDACPPKCRREGAAATVKALTSPAVVAEAWEAVAPAGWHGDEGRLFVPLGKLPQSWSWEPSKSVTCLPDPTSLELVAALCSDPGGVASAEGLAREYESQLAEWFTEGERRRRVGRAEVAWAVLPPGWGVYHRMSIHWRVTQASSLAYHEHQRTQAGPASYADPAWDADRQRDYNHVRSAARAEARRRAGSSKPMRGSGFVEQQGAIHAVLTDMLHARHWGQVARRGIVAVNAPPPAYTPSRFLGAKFDRIPHPFGPMLGIFELGYCVVDVEPGRVVLGTTWPGRPLSAPTWASLRMDEVRRRG